MFGKTKKENFERLDTFLKLICYNPDEKVFGKFKRNFRTTKDGFITKSVDDGKEVIIEEDNNEISMIVTLSDELTNGLTYKEIGKVSFVDNRIVSYQEGYYFKGKKRIATITPDGLVIKNDNAKGYTQSPHKWTSNMVDAL